MHVKERPARAALDPSKMGAASLRTFFNIASRWKLSEAEQMNILGLNNRSTLQKWKAGKVQKLSRDTLERISYVFGIFKAIGILLPIPERADAWMRAPNSASIFNGTSALDRMTRGHVSDLYVVRQYLDAQRG